MAQIFLLNRDAGTRARLRALLEAAGHTVTEAAEVEACLGLLRLTPFRATVLVEYTNLWPDGAAFVRAVAAEPALAGRHVFILTTTDQYLPLRVTLGDLTSQPLPVLRMPFDRESLFALVAQATASILGIRQHQQRAVAAHPRRAARPGTGKRWRGQRSLVGEVTGPVIVATLKASNESEPPVVEQRAASRLGTDYVLASTYAAGMAAGGTAASADAPDYVCEQHVLQMAWDVSSGRPDAPPLAQQEEYCVGWARGYIRRAGELEHDGIPDTWENDGGTLC